jgi:hypothetical protein
MYCNCILLCKVTVFTILPLKWLFYVSDNFNLSMSLKHNYVHIIEHIFADEIRMEISWIKLILNRDYIRV